MEPHQYAIIMSTLLMLTVFCSYSAISRFLRVREDTVITVRYENYRKIMEEKVAGLVRFIDDRRNDPKVGDELLADNKKLKNLLQCNKVELAKALEILQEMQDIGDLED